MPIVETNLAQPLMSSNDVVVKSDASIWFTNPLFGILNKIEGGIKKPDILQDVCRVDGRTGEPTILTKELLGPNNLCFSRNEQTLYVVEPLGEPNRKILGFDVTSEVRSIKNKRVHINADPKDTPDGIRCEIDKSLCYQRGMGSEDLDGVLIVTLVGDRI